MSFFQAASIIATASRVNTTPDPPGPDILYPPVGDTPYISGATTNSIMYQPEAEDNNIWSVPDGIDFTVEAILWFNDSALDRVFSLGYYPANFAISLESNMMYVWAGGSPITVVPIGPELMHKWNHVAIVRTNSTVFTLYINGVSAFSQSLDNSVETPFALMFLAETMYDEETSLRSHIAGFQFINGACAYPTEFTPAYPLTKHASATLFLGMTDSENMLQDGANNLVPDMNSGFTVRYSETPTFIA